MFKKVFLMLVLVAVFSICMFAEEVNTDGTLVIAVAKDAQSLDPVVVGDNASFQMYSQIFDALVTVNRNLEIVPSVATWETDDTQTWVFSIRDDVYFHNGDHLTADDVVYSFEIVLNPETASPNYENLKIIKEIEKVDDYTVKIVLEYPFAAFLERVFTQKIVNKEVREADPTEYGLNPVGSGPFVLEKWTKSNELVLKRNENYWLKKPNLAKVIMRPIPDASVALVNLEAGDVDVVMAILPDDFARIEKNPDLVLDVVPALNYYFLNFNVENEPVNDIRVRQAINYGVDMDAIVKTVLGDAGVRASASLSPSSWAYDQRVEEYKLGYDPAKAMALLKEAGYPNGFEITIYTPQDTYRRKVAELMQIQLQAIGIKAKVESLEWATYLPLIDAGKTDMYMMGWNWLTDPDGLIYDIHHSAVEAWEADASSYNGSRYYNETVDEALEEARKTDDIEVRKELYGKVLHEIFSNYVQIPLYHKVSVSAFSNKVKDFAANAIEYTFLCTPDTNVWVEE